MTDYKKIAEQLRRDTVGDDRRIVALYLAAADLCERMARGELVERAPTPRYCDFEDCSIDPLEGHQFCGHHQREADADAPIPPQDPSEAEREHCERVGAEWADATDSESITELLIRERAAAVEAYKRSLAVEPTADERAHCEDQSLRFSTSHMDRGEIVDILIRERAAARTEVAAKYEEQLADRDRRIAELEERSRWQAARAERNDDACKDANRRIAELERELAGKKDPRSVRDMVTANARLQSRADGAELDVLQLKTQLKRLDALLAAAKELGACCYGESLREDTWKAVNALDAAIAEAEREGGGV